ncbi:unnamed protein product [Medioppia subpectinata]|uniref:Beta-lactamase-related domain-containing protein n=1 Tax=Medioppia subpectinata TaxID=1979941 RepID=A0A7R9KFM8_9ACAR|nr:unnamed protein product [Medioppia subpectinata]CAG2102333.1 unnamed protein product [Medioppia subpectinata]
MDKKLIDLNHDIHTYLSPDFYPYKTFNGSAVNITVREVIYSNYGYEMVGAIIEAVLNSTYDKEIEKMFRQLNMNSTFAEKREAIYKHRPQYYMNSTKLEKSDIIDELWSYEGWWPAGGIISTASDLIKFGNAMISANKGISKDFLSEKTAKELWTPETIGKIKPKDWIELLGPFEYAKGWFIKDIPESDPYPYKKILHHGGNLFGTTTHLSVFPDQNIVGVVFSNKGFTDGLDLLIQNVAKNFKQFL